MNSLIIIIPGILNFLCWFLHLNATHAMSFLKFLIIVPISFCPVINIACLIIFIILRLINITNDYEKLSTCYDEDNLLGMSKEIDTDTISGKIIKFFTKNR